MHRSWRHSRSASIAESSTVRPEPEWLLGPSHAQLSTQGGLRRHYVQRAKGADRAANMLTTSFADFLALFGQFAGGIFPSDEDDDSSANSNVDSEREEELGQSAYGSIDRTTCYRHASLAFGDMASCVVSAPVAASEYRRPYRAPPAPIVVNSAAGLASGQSSSVQKTFFLLIKSFIGSGVLFLPRAFYNGGLLFSSVLILVVAAMSLYTMLLLVQCHERVRCGYGEMGRRLFGKWMENVVVGSILVSQIGFSCAGTIFVATNMRDLFNAATDCRFRLPLDFWVVAQMAALVPLCLVRHIKGFSAVALLADIFIVLGLLYVWGEDVATLGKLGVSHVRNFNAENYSLFLGTAAYTFEGYALILPIADSMSQPEKFPAVLSLVMVICAAVAVSIGALSYAAYGDKTEAIVLLNMPSKTAATLSVQLLYSLAILLSVPLMMFPVIRILEQALFPRRSGKLEARVKLQKNTFRTLLVAVVIGISAVGVERVDRLVSIIGGLACVPISFIFPPLFHLKAVARTRWECGRNIVLAASGAVVCVYVTYEGLSRWREAGAPPHDFCDAG